MRTNPLIETLAGLSAGTREDIVPQLERVFRSHRATLERKSDFVSGDLVAEIISMAQSDRGFLQALVRDARFSELCHTAVTKLDGLSAAEPTVQHYFHSIASDRITRPKGRSGPKRCWDREFCIVSAVAWCTSYGIYADRCDGADHESGCSLVAQALEQAGIQGLGEHGVRKIWCNRQRL
jgi:hypothetical protein